MKRRSVGIHACWADRDCRSHGVPAFTYINLWWFTVRLNPPREQLDGRWNWHLVQVLRPAPRLPDPGQPENGRRP